VSSERNDSKAVRPRTNTDVTSSITAKINKGLRSFVEWIIPVQIITIATQAMIRGIAITSVMCLGSLGNDDIGKPH